MRTPSASHSSKPNGPVELLSDESLILHPVQAGRFQVLMPNTSLLPGLFARNPNYSTELGRLIETVIRKYQNLSLIDVGANFGDSAAIAKTAADIPIICIEGDEGTFSLLEYNTAQFNDICIRKTFLGERTESMPAVFEKQGWNMTIVPENNGSSTMVQLTSLDDLLVEFSDLRRFKVLKIDAEGFDCKIIRGGLNYIKAVKPAILLEYNRDNMGRIGESGIDTLMTLKEIGYERIMFYDGQGRLVVSTSLSEVDLINDLHEYANGHDANIYHYDLCLFHESDRDTARRFQQTERERIRSMTAKYQQQLAA